MIFIDMRDHKILYFSLNQDHCEQFNNWAQGYEECDIIQLDNDITIKSVKDLSIIISQQASPDNLYVIIDYLSLFDNHDELKASAKTIRNTILQYPEVDFLFDQSGVDDDWISGIEFVLEKSRDDKDISNKVVQGFHIFQKNSSCPFFFTKLDYDNLFDGTNLRWAIRKIHFDKLNVNKENFKKLQEHRRDNLAYVIDDEPGQSRFNSIALYSSGYRVIPVHTARMLMSLNSFVESYKGKQDILTPKIIIRDFDLQFPDARKIKDYSYESPYTYHNVPKWDDKWRLSVINDAPVGQIAFYDKMIDYIRDYRYYGDDEERKDYFTDKHWDLASEDDNNAFWCANLKYKNNRLKKNDRASFWRKFLWWKKKERPNNIEELNKTKDPPIYTYIVTNGHDRMRIVSANKYHPMHINSNDCWLEVSGIQKPVSGLYFPFYYKLRDENGNRIIEDNFTKTRYKEENDEYEIDKKRANHNHGVPLDIYDTIIQMQHRAEKYYEQEQFVKTAILAQDIIELLNGFHHQMMIKAYHLKTMAENAIAMDVVGADEHELVLDALQRIEMIKEDIHRMVYPLYKQHGYIIQYQRRIKERQLLEHIFSDCRKACHENEYFNVEAIYISAMAHVNDGFTPWHIILELIYLINTIMNSWSVKKIDLNN